MSLVSSIATLDRDQLIVAHLPQVQLLARRIHARCPRHVDVEDLISAGVIGLIQAVDRFRPERECLLKTFAEHRIRGAILDYLRHLDPLPGSVRHFVKLRDEAELRLERSLGRTPDQAELAEALDFSLERYRNLDRIARAALVCSLEEVPESAVASGRSSIRRAGAEGFHSTAFA